jgi:hypothetical protein
VPGGFGSRGATLVLKIVSDATGAQKGLDDTASAAGRAQSKIGGLALPAAAAGGAILALAVDAADSASEVEQSFGAIESVYKDNAQAVKDLATASAESTGLATSDYAQMAATIGAQLKNMGVDQADLVDQTQDLINKGSDLAATFGGDTSQAVSALSALLRGERDPIERYGVSIKQADIDARLLADGVVKASDANKKLAKSNASVEKSAKDVERAQAGVVRAAEKVDRAHLAVVRAQASVAAANKAGDPARIKAAKLNLDLAKTAEAAAKADVGTAKAAVTAAAANQKQAEAAANAAGKVGGLDDAAYKTAVTQATLALLTEQTADAQGQFARESDTAAHAQQVASAEMENASAAIGTSLLPVVVALSDTLAGLARFIQDNTTLVLALGGIILGFAAAILAANVALKVYQAAQVAVGVATKIWTGIQWLLNAALTANPIGIVVALIVALVAAIVLAYNNSEEFRRIVDAVFAAVLAVIQKVVAWITTAFGTLAAVLTKPFETFKTVVKQVVDFVSGLFRGMVDAIKGAFRVVQDIASSIGGIIDKLPALPFSAAPPPAAAGRAPRLRATALGRGSRGGSTTSGPVTVNVYTTGDSMQAEQAVVRALRRANRLSAGVVSAPALGWSGVS